MTKPVDVNVFLVAFAAVDMQILQTSNTVAVVYELFSTKQKKTIEIGLNFMHTNLVFTEAFKLRNQIQYLDHRFSVKRQHRDFKGCPPDDFSLGSIWARKDLRD